MAGHPEETGVSGKVTEAPSLTQGHAGADTKRAHCPEQRSPWGLLVGTGFCATFLPRARVTAWPERLCPSGDVPAAQTEADSELVLILP